MPEVRAYIKLFGEGLSARLVLLGSVSFKRGFYDQPDSAPAVDFDLPTAKFPLSQKTADMAYGQRVLLGCFVRRQEISLLHDPILYRFER